MPVSKHPPPENVPSHLEWAKRRNSWRQDGVGQPDVKRASLPMKQALR